MPDARATSVDEFFVGVAPRALLETWVEPGGAGLEIFALGGVVEDECVVLFCDDGLLPLGGAFEAVLEEHAVVGRVGKVGGGVTGLIFVKLDVHVVVLAGDKGEDRGFRGRGEGLVMPGVAGADAHGVKTFVGDGGVAQQVVYEAAEEGAEGGEGGVLAATVMWLRAVWERLAV
jgi:hypothetical protein